MRVSFLLSCLLMTSVLFGQSRSKLSYGVSLNPTITFPLNTSSSDKPISSGSSITYKQYADSVKSLDTYKLSLGATVWINYLLSQKWTIQAGLGYSEVGFTRQQQDIQLGDRLFPGVGVGQLQELSSTSKSIDYSYKYQYLTVPVLFNYYAKRSGDFKWIYYVTGGVGLNVLLTHQIKAKLNDFVMDGETVFHIDSTGYEGTPFTVNLFLGGRVEYRINKELQLFAQPMVTAFPISVSKTEMKSYPVGVQVNLGVLYSLEGGRDESRKD